MVNQVYNVVIIRIPRNLNIFAEKISAASFHFLEAIKQ